MLIRNNNPIQFPLFYPDEGDSGSSISMGKEDIITFLGEDDETESIPLEDKKTKDTKDEFKEEKVDKKETKVKKDEEIDEIEDIEDKEEEEDDELSEIEDELEEPTDEQLELVTPVRRKEILAKYPKLFKDFPYLEKAYYREQQYTELLPTIDDAKEAVSKAETLDKFESDLMNGNTEMMLKAIHKESPKSFNKLVDNYLTVLSKVDDKAYHHVIGNTIKHTIMAMVTEGRRSSNEALQSAAQVLNQFVFGSSDFVPPQSLTPIDNKDTTKEDELTQRERQFTRQKFDSAHNDLNTRVNNVYKSTIEANIDPKQSMTDYVRRNASREALESLESLISKDSRFKVLVDKLWQRASEEDFNKSSTDRIRSAFIAKAKTLLPSVIKKARNEALKGMGKRVTSDKEEELTSKRSPVKQEQSRSRNSDRSKGIPQGMSTLEFLMSED